MATFDFFELTTDGYVWRCSVSGQFEKARKLQVLAETSNNKFYAIDLATGETLPPFAAPPRKFLDEAKVRRASNG